MKLGGIYSRFKGINFPASGLGLPSLTRQDLESLAATASRMDLARFSFVRTAAGLRKLQNQLHRLRRSELYCKSRLCPLSGTFLSYSLVRRESLEWKKQCERWAGERKPRFVASNHSNLIFAEFFVQPDFSLGTFPTTIRRSLERAHSGRC